MICRMSQRTTRPNIPQIRSTSQVCGGYSTLKQLNASSFFHEWQCPVGKNINFSLSKSISPCLPWSSCICSLLAETFLWTMGMRETWNLKFGYRWKFHEFWILWIMYPSLHLNHGNHPWMFFGASAAAMAMRAAAVLDRKTIGKWCCYHGKSLVNAGFTMGKSINNVKYAAYAWIKWDVHPTNRKWLITHPGDLWGHWLFLRPFMRVRVNPHVARTDPCNKRGKSSRT